VVYVRRFEFSPSQLKSLVQKNVRMSRPLPAVRCALQLMVRGGFVECLRRLVIIAIEDAVLHPLLPLLVWLTAVCGKRKPAAKGEGGGQRGLGDAAKEWSGARGSEENRLMAHPPTVLQATAVLRVVFDLAAVAFKDEVGRRPGSEVPSLSSEAEDWSDVHRTQVKALLIRAHGGGTEGDMDMMRAAAALWNQRFSAERRQLSPLSSSSSSSSPFSPIRRWLPFLCHLFDHSRAPRFSQFSSVSCLDLWAVQDDDVLLSAIDQHCSPLIDRLRADNSPVREAILARVREKEGQARKSTGKEEEEGEEGEEEKEGAGVRVGSGIARVQAPPRSSHVDVVRLLSSLIWRYRSSTTNKRPLRAQKGRAGEEEEEDGGGEEEKSDRRLFDRIKGEVDHLSRRIVASRAVQGRRGQGGGH
jgi:hypothetical protein